MELQGSDGSKPSTHHQRPPALAAIQTEIAIARHPRSSLDQAAWQQQWQQESSSSSCTIASACAAHSVAVTADSSAPVTPVAASAAANLWKPNKPALKPASDVLAGALARASLKALSTPRHPEGPADQGSGWQPLLGQHQHLHLLQYAASPSLGLVPPPSSGPDFRAMGAGFGKPIQGVVGAASGAGIAIGAYFACYGLACNMVSAHTDLSPSGIAFVSGGLAAAGSSVVKVPLAVCIRSVQAGVYPNVFTAASSITAKAGPARLVHRLSPHTAGGRARYGCGSPLLMKA